MWVCTHTHIYTYNILYIGLYMHTLCLIIIVLLYFIQTVLFDCFLIITFNTLILYCIGYCYCRVAYIFLTFYFACPKLCHDDQRTLRYVVFTHNTWSHHLHQIGSLSLTNTCPHTCNLGEGGLCASVLFVVWYANINLLKNHKQPIFCFFVSSYLYTVPVTSLVLMRCHESHNSSCRRLWRCCWAEGFGL